jgi:hypothetical protein
MYVTFRHFCHLTVFEMRCNDCETVTQMTDRALCCCASWLYVMMLIWSFSSSDLALFVMESSKNIGVNFDKKRL